MGKKKFRQKKSVAPLKKSPQERLEEIVGSKLDTQKEKLIKKIVSGASRESGESIREFIKRLALENKETVPPKAFSKLKKNIYSLNKKSILDDIQSLLEAKNSESKEEMLSRLSGENGGGISNTKLLKLYKTSQRLTSEFSGKKSDLISAILEFGKGKSRKIDEKYRIHLNKKSTATLLLQHDHLKKALQ